METTEQNRVLDFGGFPGRWEITKSKKDTNGEYLEMHFEINSTSGDSPPLHVHPKATESYEVLSGVLEVNVEGEWKQVPAGQKHSVPPGTSHTFRNREPVELVNVHQPALEYERFFRRFHKLATEEGVSLPPDNFKAFVLMGMLFTDHEQEIISKKPPKFLMRTLALIGKLLGYRLPDS